MSAARLILPLLLLATHLAAAATVTFAPAQPVPELNIRFTPTNGWIGADGAYTVPLTPDRTLWLFSDTWVGQVRDGHRTHATMVNNTLAIQDGRSPNAKIQFLVRTNAAGQAASFITPADHHGWFWLQSAACVDGRLYLFLLQEEKSGTGGVFGFRPAGEWLGLVTNPLAPPLDWHIEQQKLPCTLLPPGRSLTFGAATLVTGGYLYIYGTEEDTHDRHLILARAPVNQIAALTTWRFYAHGQWTNDFRTCTPLASQLATECSVTALPPSGKYRGQYVLVCTDRGLSPQIMARTSPTPWGDWSAPTVLYECPEMARDKKLFTYAAKAHPELTDGNELILTYVVNSFNFWQVASDATLYWPRFLRVPLK